MRWWIRGCAAFAFASTSTTTITIGSAVGSVADSVAASAAGSVVRSVVGSIVGRVADSVAASGGGGVVGSVVGSVIDGELMKHASFCHGEDDLLEISKMHVLLIVDRRADEVGSESAGEKICGFRGLGGQELQADVVARAMLNVAKKGRYDAARIDSQLN